MGERNVPPYGGTLGDSVLFMTEDEVDLPNSTGAPATRALLGAGYTSVGQLEGVSSKELASLHGFGPNALRLIQEALEQRGRSLS